MRRATRCNGTEDRTLNLQPWFLQYMQRQAQQQVLFFINPYVIRRSEEDETKQDIENDFEKTFAMSLIFPTLHIYLFSSWFIHLQCSICRKTMDQQVMLAGFHRHIQQNKKLLLIVVHLLHLQHFIQLQQPSVTAVLTSSLEYGQLR